jgi:hypothetical protein
MYWDWAHGAGGDAIQLSIHVIKGSNACADF